MRRTVVRCRCMVGRGDMVTGAGYGRGWHGMGLVGMGGHGVGFIASLGCGGAPCCGGACHGRACEGWAGLPYCNTRVTQGLRTAHGHTPHYSPLAFATWTEERISATKDSGTLGSDSSTLRFLASRRERSCSCRLPAPLPAGRGWGTACWGHPGAAGDGAGSGLSSSPRLFWAACISARKDIGLPCWGFGWGVGGPRNCGEDLGGVAATSEA